MFAAFARKVYDVGAFGNGSRMKYVANLLVAINNVAARRSHGARHEGRPRRRSSSSSMITTGAGNSRVFELRAPMMVKDRYDDATMKMLGLAEGHGRDRRLRQRDSAARRRCLRRRCRSMRRRLTTGHADDDTAAVCAVLEEMAGVKRGKRRRKEGDARDE